MLNQIHKDLKIPMSKLIHSSKYSQVVSQLNDFITKYWINDCYQTDDRYMFNWRNYIHIDDTDPIYTWNFNKMEYEYKVRVNLPIRYVYTTIIDDILDVKLIKTDNRPSKSVK